MATVSRTPSVAPPTGVSRGLGGPSISSPEGYRPKRRANPWPTGTILFRICLSFSNFLCSSPKAFKEKIIPGTGFNSLARYPPPRCHPETRSSLLNDLLEPWSRPADRLFRTVYITGPAGAGKSAIAQTLAENCRELDTLGAAIFLSRQGRRNNILHIIPTIAYQLAKWCPSYRDYVSQLLADDPELIDSDLSDQFMELIWYPFQDEVIDMSRVIILDGLEECMDIPLQLELLDLISAQAWYNPRIPLLWVITSRPEPHLLKFISSEAGRFLELRRLETDDPESVEGVHLMLSDGFRDIRQKFPDVLKDAKWPTRLELERLERAASGYFMFASSILQFVDNERQDPKGQLAASLKFLDGVAASGGPHPLQPLDRLYQQILSDVHQNILPITLRILRLCAEGWRTPRSIANHLGIDLSLFYSALRGLHSVLRIPPPKAHIKDLQFYHPSFPEFLRDPNRSGRFTTKEHIPQISNPRTTVPLLDTRIVRPVQQESLAFCDPGQNPSSVDAELFDSGSISECVVGQGVYLHWLLAFAPSRLKRYIYWSWRRG